MKRKIVFVSSLFCLGLATCSFHFENDDLDVTLEGRCNYENAQKNETSEGQKGLFENCSKDVEG